MKIQRKQWQRKRRRQRRRGWRLGMAAAMRKYFWHQRNHRNGVIIIYVNINNGNKMAYSASNGGWLAASALRKLKARRRGLSASAYGLAALKQPQYSCAIQLWLKMAVAMQLV